MATQPGTQHRPPPPDVSSELDLFPLGVTEAVGAEGWVVVNLETLRVVEPGYRWLTRRQAIHWARQELERMRHEEIEYRQRLDAPGGPVRRPQ